MSTTSELTAAILVRLHEIGRTIIAPNAASVDTESRFPIEAIDALKSEKLLGAYIPLIFGGLGLSIADLSLICEVLGLYCASTAMVYAMHQSQVACIVHHAKGSTFFQQYMRDIASKQYLLASSTTEMGIGGDIRSSICALEAKGDHFTLEKQAPVISYGEYADAILATCRRSPEAGRNDQSHVLAQKGQFSLEKIAHWDAMGFRGTCSDGFVLRCEAPLEQVLPTPFGEIHGETQHAAAHILWSSLWLGLASDAINKARTAVRAEARKTPDQAPVSALRLAEASTVLYNMRNNVYQMRDEYQKLIVDYRPQIPAGFGFPIRINNLKLTSSQLVVDIVSKAMMICGISGYRNDSKLSLCRHLRDAYGAALMVNNDRILGHAATMHIMQREG